MAAYLTPKAFDSKEVKVILGTVTAFGFAPDSKVTITKDEDLIIPTEGVDGELSLAINNKTKGTMTISLQNTSDFNGYLEAWVVASATSGYIAFPVIMKDPAGSKLISTIGWVQSQPDYSVAGEVGTRDWVIGLQDARTQATLLAAGAQGGIKAIGL